MKDKPFTLGKGNFSYITAFVSLIVLIAIAYSCDKYDKTLSNTLDKYATQDLTNSSHAAEHALEKSIDDYFFELQDIISSYKRGNSNIYTDDFRLYLRNNSNRRKLGNLSYVPIDTMAAWQSQSSNSTSFKAYISNILNKKDAIYLSEDSFETLELGTPVIENEKIIGALISTYSLSDIEDALFESTFEGNGSAYLVYYSNPLITLLSTTAKNPLAADSDIIFTNDLSLTQIYEDLNMNQSGMLQYEDEGEQYYTYYVPSKYDNVYMINIVPYASVNARAQDFFLPSTKLINKIITCFVILLIFIYAMQIINNRRFRKSHNNLILQQKRYDTILKHTQGCIWEYNIRTDTLTKSDPDLGIYTGYSTISTVDIFLNDSNTIYEEDKPIFLDLYENLKNGNTEISAEIRAKDLSGQYKWFEITGTAVTDSRGTPILIVGQTNNIDERKIEYEKICEDAKKDSLTKLFNRSSAVELIDQAIADSSPDSLHALFMIDIDDFKSINDTYGHTFGDAVLLELSKNMTKIFTGEHIIARFGGDEFIVFISDISSINQLKNLAKKLSKSFSSIATDEASRESITGSIGISIYPKDGMKFDQLLQKADMALYYSKSVGKNCFSFYTVDLMSSMEYLPSKNDDTPTHYLHTENSTLIDSSILSNTVDVLCDAKKLNTSINLILNIIGNYYGLDSICIYEHSEDNQSLNITFEWASDFEKKISNYFTRIPMNVANGLEFYRNSSSGIFYHNAALSLPYEDSAYTDTIRTLHTGSLFQCAIMEQGQYQGYIEANRNDPEKPWSQIEINTITLTTKIIGSYLLKLRIQETADELTKKDLLTRSNNLFVFSAEADRIVNENSDKEFALIYMDINNFKYFNENYGYSEGDQILRYFAQLLNDITSEDETYGRINADNFIMLLQFTDEHTLSARLSELNRRLNSLQKTITNNYNISLIMGIYKIKPDDDDISACIDRANIARKSIIDRHKTKCVYFNESMKSRLLKQKEIEAIMEDALTNEEYVVYYQPKFNLKKNIICGAEALVRWKRPDGSLVPPNEFIPIFEDNGFVVEIDFYVLQHVCKEIRELLNTGKNVVPISVNFSRMHLRDRTFVSRLISIVSAYNIPPNLIEIEITESALVYDNDYLNTILDDIHRHGFKLAMDDFGSGLSSLNLLRELPFDVLKLDKDFFQKGTATERERTIIEHIVKMALDLNMEIVSEGVETEEQADFLRSIGCPIAQGYLYEKPIPKETFVDKYC